MSQDDDKYYKKNDLLKAHIKEDESGEGEAGGGQSGQIEFRDFLSNVERVRDDLLPANEKRRLLSVHKDTHITRVKAQKERRELYAKLKSGKIPLRAYREGSMSAGMSSQFKPNPAIADKAQFSGIDKQVIGDPTQNVAETNQDQRQEVDNELRYRLGMQNTPKFNPKPSPFK